jgi:protein ImuB
MIAQLLPLPLPVPAQRRAPAVAPRLVPTNVPDSRPQTPKRREVWLALHLRGWQLHAAVSALKQDERTAMLRQPLAVVDADRRSTLLACNTLAAARGVRAGHSMNAAIALCSELQFLPRHAEAEARELEALATMCDRYTPKVSVSPPNEMLLEIRGSIKLFGGLNALIERIESDVRELGVEANIAVTPTPQSALWIARLTHRHVVRPRELMPVLGKVPVGALLWPPEIELRLARFGVMTLGDLLRLPRSGLARRIGPEHLAQLDHATGRFRQLRRHHRSPQPYQDRVLMDFEIETTKLLGTLLERRLKRLDNYFRTSNSATDRIRVELKHREHAETVLEMGLAVATSDITHIGKLLHEHLGRLALPAPVIELNIRVEHQVPAPQQSRELFKAQHAHVLASTEPQARLLEQLRSRLGAAAMRSVRTQADFRPECAHRTVSAHVDTNTSLQSPPPELIRRPLWLLRESKRLSQTQASKFRVEQGPERIESGWWDGMPVDREYWVARSPSGAQVWTYRDCRDGAQHVQGLFG